jgi:hypothetical protein
MKKAIILIAALLVFALVIVGVILIAKTMMDNFAETGSVFGSSPIISDSFLDKLFGAEPPSWLTPDIPKESGTGSVAPPVQATPGSTYEMNGYLFTLLDDGTYAVSIKREGDLLDVLYIPESVNGIPVTTISKPPASHATYGGERKIVIPDSVTKIDKYAFYNFFNLEEVVIGNGVTTIGERAFMGCDSLQSIVIPDSVLEIGKGAFFGCDSLKSVKLSRSLTSIPLLAFGDTPISYIELHEGITSIERAAFEGCVHLTKIFIPSSVEFIDSTAFLRTDSLESIEVDPKNPYYYSLGNCLIQTNTQSLIKGCKSSEIPPQVTEIGDYAFTNSSITQVIIPNGVTRIGMDAFRGCKELLSIEIPSNVKTIEQDAFYKCESLKEIILNEGLEQIGGGAFSNCKALESIVIPASVSNISTHAFSLCYSLKSISLLGPVKIGDSAFYNCTALENIDLSYATVIQNGAFYYCENLTTVKLSTNTTEIWDQVFSYTKLQTVNFEGTMEEWEKVFKDSKWIENETPVTVICTDGKIEY